MDQLSDLPIGLPPRAADPSEGIGVRPAMVLAVTVTAALWLGIAVIARTLL